MPNEFHQSAHALFATGAKGCNDLLIAEAGGEGLYWYREFA